MTAEHRAILEAVDVIGIRLDCVKCRAAVVVRPEQWKEAPFECPSCKEMWELPRVNGQAFSPLQHFGVGLRQLLEQSKSDGPTRLPYRVRLEIGQA